MTRKPKYILTTDQMQWGVGIENETMIYTKNPDLLGKDIVTNNEELGIMNDKKYETYILSDITDDSYFDINTGVDTDELQEDIMVYELKTVHFRNKTIKQYINEIIKTKELVLTKQSNINGYYPEIGTAMPISLYDEVEEKRYYTLKYSGSYHLNLSLPYSKRLLRLEEDQFKMIENSIILNLEDKLKCYKHHGIKNETWNHISEEILKLTNLSITNYINKEYENIAKLGGYEARMFFNKIIKSVRQYQKNKFPFHQDHNLWAVCIQWLMPLILSAYSSVHPLSIGDNDYYTELSYRLVHGDFSFINMSNIKHNGIPISRKSPWNDHKSNKLLNKFSGMENAESIIQKNGYEFRADSSYGYDFGMEIRIFDNFNTIYLEQLLELLFLIADHMYAAKIEMKTIENPFNNEILINSIVMIFKQGWNTTISDDYIGQIKKNLNINIDFKSTIAYDIINEIYQYLQQLYILNGIGHYSQYVIGRTDTSICSRKLKLKKLPNINRKSWEESFERLYWDVDHNEITKIKTNRFEIKKLINENKNDEAILLIKKNLGNNYEKYENDVIDIFYYINSSASLP